MNTFMGEKIPWVCFCFKHLYYQDLDLKPVRTSETLVLIKMDRNHIGDVNGLIGNFASFLAKHTSHSGHICFRYIRRDGA